jgi:uncharacterized protein YerC
MSKPQEDRDVRIPPELIHELLTDSELRMVKQRLLIIRLLKEGNSIRTVAEQVGVGTDTVVRMARKMESNPALRKAFETFQPLNTPSKWVFGQVSSEEPKQ